MLPQPPPSGGFDYSSLPPELLEAIALHIVTPVPPKDNNNERSDEGLVKLEDLFNFRLVCRKWDDVCKESFFRQWMMAIGLGKTARRAAGDVEGSKPYDVDTWKGQALLWARLCKRYEKDISRFSHSTETYDLPLPPSQVRSENHVLKPALSLVQRQCGAFGRPEVGTMQYNIDWMEGARFATAPPVTALKVSVSEYIPALGGFDLQFDVASKDGVTMADFWKAINDWFNQPLTKPQLRELKGLVHRFSNRDYTVDPNNLPQTDEEVMEHLTATYSTRRDLSTKPLWGVRVSEPGRDVISMVWHEHDATHMIWEPKRKAAKSTPAPRGMVFPAETGAMPKGKGKDKGTGEQAGQGLGLEAEPAKPKPMNKKARKKAKSEAHKAEKAVKETLRAAAIAAGVGVEAETMDRLDW